MSICRKCKNEFKSGGPGKGLFCTLHCRFMDKVTVTSSCWLWKAATNRPPRGYRYGTIKVKGITSKAHRISYQIFVGNIPEGKFVCHACDNPICVNPDHLWIGSQKQNVKDMLSKGRRVMGYRENSPNAKLSQSDYESIFKKREEGEKVKDIAKEFGVVPQTITNILNKRTWVKDGIHE